MILRAFCGDVSPRNSKTPVSKISEHFRFALEESFQRIWPQMCSKDNMEITYIIIYDSHHDYT